MGLLKRLFSRSVPNCSAYQGYSCVIFSKKCGYVGKEKKCIAYKYILRRMDIRDIKQAIREEEKKLGLANKFVKRSK